ncbi:piggyBac transposable element-derived protein 3-like [Ischnura elegans]|nr:piggyBac transposable element-derived protein 3-like [Ischnura elegans]
MPPYVHDVEDLFCENEEGSQNFLDMFFEYFPPSFWKSVVEQSNLYSVQVRDHRSINMTYDEIIRFVGVSILMGSLNYPQTRLYWSRDLAVPLIQKVMSRDRFFELRNHLHFVDKFVTSDSDDKLQKVRPILDAFLKKCHMLPRSNEQSVDEQMISFTGRCPNRQYVPNKPHPVGLKNFVLAERDGLVLDFHIYVGKGTIPDKDMRELGLGAGIVKLLTRTISHSIIYCDRFFTSEKLGDYLVANNFNLCGTVMKNRVGGALSILKSDKELKRGDYDEVLRSDKKMCCVKWQDSKAVTMLSTCIGSEPHSSCLRWDKTEKRKREVNQPLVIKKYNQCMGGIDLCDRLLAYYSSSMRTKKWPLRVFTHFVDLAIVNSWVMYRRNCVKADVPKREIASLLQFRTRLGNAMIHFESGRVEIREEIQKKRGRPSKCSSISPGPHESSKICVNEETGIEDQQIDHEDQTQQKRRRIIHPVNDVRFDRINHWPIFSNDKNASRCRHSGCSSRTRIKCQKCDVYLCVSLNGCFQKFHTRH